MPAPDDQPQSDSPMSVPEGPAAVDTLPPIEPPNARFILQLFLIPLLIVSVIVAVWLMFTWLAHMGSNPRQYVQSLGKPGTASWQAAANLSDALRNPRYEELKSDTKLAGDLADTLTRQLKAGLVDTGSLQMRMFICRALGEFGEFHVPTGLEALIEAASTERDTPEDQEFGEVAVRRAAIEAIAVLAHNVSPDKLRANDELMQTLRAASSEHSDVPGETVSRAELRANAAFTLGVLGGPESLDRLAIMCGDAAVNVRFNAATGLARHGDVRANRVLIQMIDPSNESTIEAEPSESLADWKRALVITNGLRAIVILSEANLDDDLTDLAAAIRKQDYTTLESVAQLNIKPVVAETLKTLDARTAK